MNLIRIGPSTFNFDLIVMVEDRELSDPDRRMVVVYALGGGIELFGAEAEAMRRFLARHSRTFDDSGGADFAAALPLVPPSDGAKQPG